MGKIPNTSFGAVVSGVSLNELNDAAFQKIEEAFLEHSVLIFPNQAGLTREAQAAFGRRFGKLEIEIFQPGNFAGIVPGSGVDFKQIKEHGYRTLLINEAWHVDSTYMPVSSKAGMLFAEKLPPSGGDTGFCDMRAAFDALDPETKIKIETLSAYHSIQYSYAAQRGGGEPYFPASVGSSGQKGGFGMHGQAYLRPLVKTHPVTKRRSLFVASHAFGIPGMSSEESAKLLEGLMVFATGSPSRTIRHVWHVGDLVLWDNRCVAHRAYPWEKDLNEPAAARVMRGTRVSGEPESEHAFEENSKVLDEELNRIRRLHNIPEDKSQAFEL